MSRGGSRSGAGRPGYRLKAEQSRRIDIRRWQKGGFLVEGRSFSWQWTRGEEKTGNIGVWVVNGSIRLNYSIDGTDASQRIAVTSTPCNYGGSRQWFCCPVCHGRAALLYLRSGRFACRTCQRVSYTSQSGSEIDRVCNRFHRLNEIMMASKPKWQRWATREKLTDRYMVASEQFDLAIYGRLRALGCPDLINC